MNHADFYADVAWDGVTAQAEEELAQRLAGWSERYPDVLKESAVAQLLVVGSHGRGGFAGLVLGSVSSAVAQSARVPVIVARQS